MSPLIEVMILGYALPVSVICVGSAGAWLIAKAATRRWWPWLHARILRRRLVAEVEAALVKAAENIDRAEGQ